MSSKDLRLFEELSTKKDEKLLIQHGKDVEGHALFSWEGAGPESQVYLPGTFRPALKYHICRRPSKFTIQGGSQHPLDFGLCT